MMGTGKSTVAPLVAERLHRAVIDTDAALESATGGSIGDWFAGDVAAFRAAERAVVVAAAGRDVVVACGGGVVLDPVAVAAMRSTGLVVCLEAPVAVLASRVGSGDGRPLLGAEPAAALALIGRERDPLYRAAAQVTVAASGEPDEVAEAVIAAWTSWS